MRTDNEIKNHWNSRIKKRLIQKGRVHRDDHHPNNLKSSSCPSTSATTTPTTTLANNPSEESKSKESNISTIIATTSAQLLLNELAASNKLKSSNCLASLLSQQESRGGHKKAVVSKSASVLNKVATTYLKPNKSHLSLVDAVKTVLSKSSQDCFEDINGNKANIIANSSTENSSCSISISDFEIGNNSSEHIISPNKSENGQEIRCVNSATSPRVVALNKMASKLAFVKRHRPTLLSSTDWRVSHDVSSESIESSHDVAGSAELSVFQSSDDICLVQDPKEVLFEGIASAKEEFDMINLGVVGDDHNHDQDQDLDDELMRSLFSNFGDDLIIGEHPIEFNGGSTSNSSYNGCSDVEERIEDLETAIRWDL